MGIRRGVVVFKLGLTCGDAMYVVAQLGVGLSALHGLAMLYGIL